MSHDNIPFPRIHDTCAVHSLHLIPGTIGGLASVLYSLLLTEPRCLITSYIIIGDVCPHFLVITFFSLCSGFVETSRTLLNPLKVLLRSFSECPLNDPLRSPLESPF